jgi:putative spermidine/putrescine transport system permease protein
VTANLAGVDPAIEDAALSLGATPVVTALKVTLPLIWPGVVAAALFSFVVSFGNIEVSLFLVQPGQTTLPIAILQYLEWKVDPTVAAVSALQIALVAAALLITDRFVSLAKVV